MLEDRAFDPDPEVRSLAVSLLSGRDSAAADVLASALEDESPDVVVAAAERLAERRPERAADLLAECLAARPELVGPLALSLEALGDPGAEDLLWQWMDDVEPAAQAALVRALGAAGGPRSVTRLLPRLEEADDRMRREIMGALVRIRERHPRAIGRDSMPPSTASWILDLLRREEKGAVLTGLPLAVWLRPEGTLKAVVALMADPDARVRDAALESFGLLASGAEGLALAALAAGTPESIARGLDRLATARDPESRRVLRTLLEHPEPVVRQRAASLAGRAGHADLAAPLAALLLDSNGHTRARAAEALGRLRDHSAGERLEALLEDPYPDVREAAIAALNALRGYTVDPERALARSRSVGGRAAALRASDVTRAPGALEAAIADPEPEIRFAAAASLAARGAWRDEARALLLDEDSRVRALALAARLKARPFADLEALEPMIRDPDPGVREILALGLADAPAAAASAWLRTLLRDPSAAVGRAAARGLARRAEPAALPALLDAASGGALPVASAAIEALGALGDPEALPRLRALARGGPESLQAAAARAARTLEARAK